MIINRIVTWWDKHAWRVRVYLYTVLVFLPRLLLSMVEGMETMYEKFMTWLLWKALNCIFRYRAKEGEDDTSTS